VLIGKKIQKHLEEAQQNKIDHIVKKLDIKRRTKNFRSWLWMGRNGF
jgi:hypothetical protein